MGSPHRRPALDEHVSLRAGRPRHADVRRQELLGIEAEVLAAAVVHPLLVVLATSKSVTRTPLIIIILHGETLMKYSEGRLDDSTAHGQHTGMSSAWRLCGGRSMEVQWVSKYSVPRKSPSRAAFAVYK